ncbi:MAG TPA: NAD(P)/FAD-dependent oxidoreductase [Gemmatimonadaceae bacterium]|nr:NAD(P)/FAD-dependent oxidoreductase [Gemmatimonadaceae bacterium]
MKLSLRAGDAAGATALPDTPPPPPTPGAVTPLHPVAPSSSPAPTRIVVLGGGFGGVTAARQLERLCAGHARVEVTLVSRDNFFILTPLLFEACSGRLELRHCAQPIRPALRRARFIEATVREVDVERRVVHAVAPSGAAYELPYDQLVVALGATTNESLIPGSPHALTFKSMTDALLLRNRIIEQFERADAAGDTGAMAQRRGCLTFVVIGGGLVGVELLGELTAFAEDVLRYYPRIRREELRFHLFEAGPRILPEVDPALAEVALRVLRRRGADVRTATPVRAIEPRRVHLATETIDAGTIVLAAGIVPNPVAAAMPVAHDARGRIAVDAAMRSTSHPEIWALGDCAAIPDPDGHPYPALAQHAVREARRLARNVAAALEGRPTAPFVHRSLGTMASLGHSRAVAQVMGVRLTGFPAWWLRRTYYLLQMPRWDRRLRIVLDWTAALFSRPDITKVDVPAEPATVETLLDRAAEAPALRQAG